METTFRKTQPRAAATAELAILTPVLLVILFAIIEFGYYFMSRQVVQHAAAEAVRLATLPGFQGEDSTADIRSYVQNNILDVLGPATTSQFTLTRQIATAENACEKVTISVPTSAVMAGFPNFVFSIIGMDDLQVEYTVTAAHPDYAGTGVNGGPC